MVFQCIYIRQVPWEVLKTHGTWRMLMHEKPCLIPIIKTLCYIFYCEYHILLYTNNDKTFREILWI